MAYVVACISCLTVGFAAGLFSFRVKNRWCPQCGDDTEHLAHQARRRAPQPADPDPDQAE